MQKSHQLLSLEIARKVRNGEVTRAQGARLISQNTGIPVSSAGIIIAVYINMSVGKIFKRTINVLDLEFFVSSIESEEGSVQLKKALTALRRHIEYRMNGGFKEIKSSAILERFESRLDDISGMSMLPMYLSDLDINFSKQVEDARKNSRQERQRRLSEATKIPKRVARLVYIFQRNPDVVIEVLARAQGYCEKCKLSAPFQRRSDGTAYLEVHHKQPLSEMGEDTLENAIALCPNCHRQSHFG